MQRQNGFPVFAVDRLLIAALTTPNGFRAGGHTVEAVACDQLATPAWFKSSRKGA
jgi:hypothetical protein